MENMDLDPIEEKELNMDITFEQVYICASFYMYLYLDFDLDL
jgi:hypothetical protein